MMLKSCHLRSPWAEILICFDFRYFPLSLRLNALHGSQIRKQSLMPHVESESRVNVAATLKMPGSTLTRPRSTGKSPSGKCSRSHSILRDSLHSELDPQLVSLGAGSDAHHLDAATREGFDSLIRSSGVGDDGMNIGDRADERGADDAEFARISDSNHLARLLEHLAKDQRFVGFERSCAALDIEANHAEEDLVHVDVVEEVQRSVAGERKRPGPGDGTPGEEGADSWLIAQFHADVDGVGDYLEVLPMAQAAADEGCRGSGGQPDGLVLTDQLGGGQTDAALFVGEALFARLKAAVVAKRLIEERLDQRCAAMGTPDESAIFKVSQVAADAWGRGADFLQDRLDRGGTQTEQEFHDFFSSVVELRWHTQGLYRRVAKNHFAIFITIN
uniref:Uncharacterized protein n=1 Tax=mine drainage metagenome TaxID=410659 RepID=E6PYZ8_9ZZZZ